MSSRYRRRFCPGWMLLLVALVAGYSVASTGEFQPDAQTMLLAHFNETSLRADYSMANEVFPGSGTNLAGGYYGKGIDLCGVQFNKDFMKTGDRHTPDLRTWGFSPRGVINFRQGTLEFWFKFPPANARKNALGYDPFMNAILGRNVKNKNGKYYENFAFALRPDGGSYFLPFLSGDYAEGKINFRTIKGFNRNLKAEEWHHFALCWGPGEIIGWLDGRPLLSHDMTGQYGFALVSNPAYPVAFFDIVMDELRVSKVARYTNSFEPNWRDGQRPEYAFTGDPEVKRYPLKPEPADVPAILAFNETGAKKEVSLGGMTLEFDQAKGILSGFKAGGMEARRNLNGLLLREGLERKELEPQSATDWKTADGETSFSQNFGGKVDARHKLTAKGGAVCWEVTLVNRTGREIWLEALMSLPVPMQKVAELFDGSFQQRKLMFPRRRDHYTETLPFVAASGGNYSIGVGIDPHITLNDIVGEWIPEGESGTIRQGTRLALFPGEEYTYRFQIVAGKGSFETLDAIHRYHELSPDLYRLQPDVPVYSYLPTNSGYPFDASCDAFRLCYIGGLWTPGPGHHDGDFYGTPKWWDNPKYYGEISYQGFLSNESVFKTLGNLRKGITKEYLIGFDNWYPLRRCHYCPDLTPSILLKDLWPGYIPNDDPSEFGQYYSLATHSQGDHWMINEYNTPLGAQITEDTKKYANRIGTLGAGFINDMSHMPHRRQTDAIAKKTAGRSFSADMGTFVRGAMGRTARYQAINNLVFNGHRMSIWSDGGRSSYSLCAYSSADAIEGWHKYEIFSSMDPLLMTTRMLLGEKPMVCWGGRVKEYFGVFHSPEEFTARTLRDYFRYCDAQMLLLCLKHGITTASDLLIGNQKSMEWTPILVESTVLGRKIVPGGRVKEPLWLCRAGEGLDSLIVAANQSPKVETTDVNLINDYFPGSPLFGPYYGGEVRHEISGEQTRLKDISVGPRDLQAFKILGCLKTDGSGKATTDFQGDGITVKVDIRLDVNKPGELTLNSFAPMYAAKEIEVDGRSVSIPAGKAIPLSKGRHRIRSEYVNRVFQFSADDWAKVDLIRDGMTDFYINANSGKVEVVDMGAHGRANPIAAQVPSGFERGTAMMLSDFITAYDDEDGILGNLEPPLLGLSKPADFSGWTVKLTEEPQAETGRVRIDKNSQTLFIEGKTQGEIRRTMVVFLRLLDRKYPHVGRFLPFRGHYNQPFVKDGKIQWKEWRPRKGQYVEFFEKFEDPNWVLKPILREEFEKLYAKDNMDFAGKYPVRSSPYIFEPTYTEDFVYGYAGSGKARTEEDILRLSPKDTESEEELNRPLNPDRDAIIKKLKEEKQKTPAPE